MFGGQGDSFISEIQTEQTDINVTASKKPGAALLCPGGIILHFTRSPVAAVHGAVTLFK